MLEVKGLTVGVGEFLLSDFSLSIDDGECVALMGPSGCGKTTLMEAVCGLRSGGVLSGTILLGGVDITDLPPGARMIGLVPQDVALFPTLTVRVQLEFGPTLHRWERDEGRVVV